MKKVIVILLILAILGGAGYGIWYFYDKYQNEVYVNSTLQAQNAQVQAQLDAIGAMTTCYEVSTKSYAGTKVNTLQLIPVSVPVSTLADTSITDPSQITDKYFKVNVNPGTILSTDMFMDEDTTELKFTREISFDSLPVTTKPGDYMDLRILYANGEEYVIFNKKRLERVFNTTVTIYLSEEENAILNAALSDYSIYNKCCVIYMLKYLEPGIDDSIAFYPVQHDQENMIKFNPNIKDITRCINPTLRDHIDEVCLLFSDSDNQAASALFVSMLRSQGAAQLTAQQDWINQNTLEDGSVTLPNEISQVGTTTKRPVANDTGATDYESFDESVGNAMDSLDSDIQQMIDTEAIE